jgi:hypothetical protein
VLLNLVINKIAVLYSYVGSLLTLGNYQKEFVTKPSPMEMRSS